MPVLNSLSKLFDPCIGDPLANFLIISAMIDLEFPVYKSRPTRDLTIKLKDKSVISFDSYNQVLTPLGLQNKIDEFMRNYKGSGFFRCSGTEDVVRIHVEGKRQNVADELCVVVAQVIYDECGGVGHYPEISYIDK